VWSTAAVTVETVEGRLRRLLRAKRVLSGFDHSLKASQQMVDMLCGQVEDGRITAPLDLQGNHRIDSTAGFGS
jgi:hypothetical protein